MRVVFLTQRLPYAPNRGDRIRAHHELRALATRHEVHVVSMVHDEEEASHQGDLQGVAASVSAVRVTRWRNYIAGAASLPTRKPLTHALLHSPAMRPVLEGLVTRIAPELVLAYCSSMARYALEPPLADTPFILDMVDVDSAKWSALAAKAGIVKRWIYSREARLLAGFEARATHRARMTYVVNEREAVVLRGLAGQDARIGVLENGVDIDYLRPGRPTEPTQDVVFCGVMNYPPNEQGALWLSREVWPLVIDACPDARLILVGANPSRQVLGLQGGTSSIVVTGTVADVRPYLWGSAVMVAPLQVARGVQNKVLEAVAAGLPAVVTRAVFEGLPAEVAPACRVADSPDAFAAATVSLLRESANRRREIANSASLDLMGWSRRMEPLMTELNDAADIRPGDSKRSPVS